MISRHRRHSVTAALWRDSRPANRLRYGFLYGITPAPDDAWIQLHPDLYSTYHLPWKKEYGWFDCNKVNPADAAGGVPDGSMCWAAVGSNLLHWWLKHNMKYVEMSSTRAVMAMQESTGSFTATSRRHRHADTLITTADISRMYSPREYVSERAYAV